MGLLARVKEYQSKTAHSEHRGGLLQRARELREQGYHGNLSQTPSSAPAQSLNATAPEREAEDDELFVELQFPDHPNSSVPLPAHGDILIGDEEVLPKNDLDAITEIHLADEIPDDEIHLADEIPTDEENDNDFFLSEKQSHESETTSDNLNGEKSSAHSDNSDQVRAQTDNTVYDKTDHSADDAIDDFSPQAGRLIPQVLAGLGSIPRGFEAPYMAWGILRDFLGIQQGALLLQDHAEDTLIPYSASGLSFDSLQKLRIDSKDVKSMAVPGRIRDPRVLEQWKLHLSIREAELLEELMVIPMGKGETGLCVLFKTPLFSLGDETLSIMTSTLAEALGKMLENSRTILLNNISPRFIVSMNQFPGLLQQALENESSLILGIQLQQILDSLLQASPDALEKRVALDAMRVIGSIVQEDGAVTSDSDYIYILFSDIEDIDPQLIKEQLEFSIQQAFSTELPGIQFVEFQPQEVEHILRHMTRRS